MNITGALRQLEFARQTPFRNMFKSYVGGEVLPTLSDEAIALVLAASALQVTTNSLIAAHLPLTIKGHFMELLEIRTARGDFFTRFALFVKTSIDCLLVGFGTDEMYYVVATWDGRGCDLWMPKRDLHDRPVLA